MRDRIKGLDYIDIIKKMVLIIVAYLTARYIDVPGVSKYAILLALSFLLALPYFKRFNTEWLVLAAPNIFYVAVGGIVALISGRADIYMIKMTAFLLVPFCIAAFYFTAFISRIKWFINAVFGIFVITFIIQHLPYFNRVDLMESTYAFVFGAFVIYYFSRKSWGYLIAAVLSIVLAHKIIVWYAVAFCILIILISRTIKSDKVKYVLMTISFILFEVVSYIFISIDYDKFLGAKYEYFDAISRGRLNVWMTFKENLLFSPLFFGRGMGYTLSYFGNWIDPRFAHIHNDYLQIYAEIGFLGMFIYLFLFSFLPMHHCFLKKSINKCIGFWGILFYTFIIWTTDNTQIYILYWVPVWLLMLDTIFSMDDEYATQSIHINSQYCPIMGVNIAAVNMDSLLELIGKNIKEWAGKYICVSNVHTTVTAYDDKDYLAVQNGAILAIPDGGPLSAEGRRRGYAHMSRTTGPDLMVEIMKVSVERGYRHYFYGSTQETLDMLREKLEIKYPGIQIVGMVSPPFKELTDEEDAAYTEKINNANADFIWVGLGAPKQEKWMAAHENRVNGLMIGVGAGFDYLAGNLKRAPKWMQDNNLEWLYRLIQEPKRLFMRYLSTNIKFLWLAVFRGL